MYLPEKDGYQLINVTFARVSVIINTGQGKWSGAILCIVDHVGTRSYVSFFSLKELGNSIRGLPVLDVHSSTLASNVMEMTRLPTAIFVPPLIEDQQNRSPRPPSLPTPIRIDRFLSFLDGYTPSAVRYLRDGFTAGFHLDYTGHLISVHSKNSSSAVENPEAVDFELFKELSAHRLAGPSSVPPFETFHVSPLGIVPKKTHGEYRLIHHLSFPKASVNDFFF